MSTPPDAAPPSCILAMKHPARSAPPSERADFISGDRRALYSPVLLPLY